MAVDVIRSRLLWSRLDSWMPALHGCRLDPRRVDSARRSHRLSSRTTAPYDRAPRTAVLVATGAPAQARCCGGRRRRSNGRRPCAHELFPRLHQGGLLRCGLHERGGGHAVAGTPVDPGRGGQVRPDARGFGLRQVPARCRAGVAGFVSFLLVRHPAAPDPRIHETGYRVGAWCWPRGRLLYGAESPFSSLTRSPASTPYCETGFVR